MLTLLTPACPDAQGVHRRVRFQQGGGCLASRFIQDAAPKRPIDGILRKCDETSPETHGFNLGPRRRTECEEVKGAPAMTQGIAAYDPKSGDLQPADWSADDPSSHSLTSASVKQSLG